MRSLLRLLAVIVLISGAWAVPVQRASAANLDPTADRVFGQADFTHATANAGGLSATSLSGSAGVALDRLGNLYIADWNNNRVLEYNAPLTSGMAANRVFGQDGNFNTSTVNYGGISAKSLYHPFGVAVDALGNLYVADQSNNRVLEYDTPLKPGGDSTADRVFGQGGNFTTNSTNNGGIISASSLSGPTGVAVDSRGNVYIADYGNNRVLEFTNPLLYDTIATMVFGQGGSFSDGIINKGGISADSLSSPAGLAVDAQGNLFVAEWLNHRVLEYDTPASSYNTTADRVFGQGGIFTTNTVNKGGISADSLNSPASVAMTAGGDLYVADEYNHRLLEYTNPLTTNTTADMVFGQGDSFTTNTVNKGGLSANSLYSPTGVAVDAWGNLYTADFSNNRVLEYELPVPNSAPTLTALSPSTVAAGGPAFTLTVNGSGYVAGSVVRWNGVDRPTTYLSSAQLNAAISAADAAAGGPFAVTVFTPTPGGGVSAPISLTLFPRANLDVTADGVLGQPNFISADPNNHLLPGGANRLNYAYRMAVDPYSGRLFVADIFNNRVLSWPDAASFANSQAADLVIGQPDFTSLAANTGGVSASSLNNPASVAVDAQGNLYVADKYNSRVLIYLAPLSSGMGASTVIGQPDFSSNSSNNGNPNPSRTSLSQPAGVVLDQQGNLYVTDQANNRILFYYNPRWSDTSADMVVGQLGAFTTNAANSGGISANSLYSPENSTVDAQGNLYVADFMNNRVLEYDTPLILGTTADRVFGQAGSFGAGGSNNGGISENSLAGPAGVMVDAQGNLYVADWSNQRVLEYNTPLISGTAADKVFGQGGAFNTNNPNKGGISATSLEMPTAVALDSRGNLFVADAGNNRVLEYDLPLPHGVPAIGALAPSTLAAGGPAFTLMVNGTGFVPGSVVRWGGSDRPTTYISGAQLSAAIPAADVASGGPFPVTVFNPAPGGGTSTLVNLPLYPRHNLDTTADGVLGQPNFSTNTYNNLLMPPGGRLTISYDAAVDPNSGRLFVADFRNNRLLSWPNAAAFANSQAADLVLGQPNFLSIFSNTGGRSAASLSLPTSLAVDGEGNLYVVDCGNHRVLLYMAPLASGMAASKVFGQNGSFTTGGANNGGRSENSLNNPVYLALDTQGNLYVGDNSNNRVLEYDNPLASGGDTTADRVFGQGGSFSTATANNGGISPNSLNGPIGVAVDAQGNLYVADFGNNRVLEYDTPLAPGGNTTADHVFGQGNDFTTNASNKGGISADSLGLPVDVAVDAQGELYVADYGNNRVLVYDTPLVSGGNTSADLVFGQNGNFTTGTPNNGGVGPASLSAPFGLGLDPSGNLFVTDSNNNRLLEFDVPVPYGVPSLAALNPASGVAGSPDQVIEVVGANFVAVSVARWNGADLATEYEDSTHLSVTISANDLAAGGTAQIAVFSPAPGGGLSGPLTFTVDHPVPTLTLLSPAALRAGSEATVLTLTGSNFFATSVARWNGADLPTSYLDGGHLRATIPANLLSPGSAAITVFNPAPGGGSSAGMTMTITQFQVYVPSITK